MNWGRVVCGPRWTPCCAGTGWDSARASTRRRSVSEGSEVAHASSIESTETRVEKTLIWSDENRLPGTWSE
eukprot:978928-Prymnesium_polylepis.1